MEHTTSFFVDKNLLKAVAERLIGKDHIYWLLGASCTGKTQVCRHLASKGVAICDMDARIFGFYLEKYAATRHPASCAWLKRADAMQWALSLSWEEFNNLNEATNIEILDIFSEEVQASTETRPLVVDGGLSHPYLLTQVLPLANILCLQRDDDSRAGSWERDANKLQMKNMVQALPDGHKLWNKFLSFDRMIAKTLEDQCRQTGIRCVQVHEEQTASKTMKYLLGQWNI